MRTGAFQRCAQGERVCGDDWAVVRTPGGWLLAVIDGLGHGQKAREAALGAHAALERCAGLELRPMVAQINMDLRASRGACLGLARVDADLRRVCCVIVGNVEIAGISQAPIRPLPSPGIVGREIRKLRVFEGTVSAGDRLFLYSDGISRKVDLSRYRGLDPSEAAEAVVCEFGQAHDDATCLVADVPHEPA